jgi:iron complex transport system substrate-binding protein
MTPLEAVRPVHLTEHPMPSSSERFQEWRESMQPRIPLPWRTLVETIIRAAEEVHGILGAGLERDLCEAALAHELSLRGLSVERQRRVALNYKGVELPARSLDLIVNGLVALALRAGDRAAEADAARLLGLLRAADLPLGLVLDFGAVNLRNGVYRRLNRTASEALRLVTPEPPHAEAPRAESA